MKDFSNKSGVYVSKQGDKMSIILFSILHLKLLLKVKSLAFEKLAFEKSAGLIEMFSIEVNLLLVIRVNDVDLITILGVNSSNRSMFNFQGTRRSYSNFIESSSSYSNFIGLEMETRITVFCRFGQRPYQD